MLSGYKRLKLSKFFEDIEETILPSKVFEHLYYMHDKEGNQILDLKYI